MSAAARQALQAQRLALPARGGRHRVVIDTDAANEIDDQFALAWALLSPESLAVEAIYAAPFSFVHRHAQTPHLPRTLAPFAPPGEGMARSFDEIGRVLAACGQPELPHWHGMVAYLPLRGLPPRCPAVDDLIERALATPLDGPPLYVLAMGCPTNVAAALLLEPRIAEHIVVVWTSGYPSTARQANRSFNFEQDLRATRRLMAGDVPLVYLPGYHVGAQLRLSWPEVQAWVEGRGAIGTLLADLYTHNPLWPLVGVSELFAHSWVIWDLICVAWLLNPDWVPSELVPMPRVAGDLRWAPRHMARGRPLLMREAYALKRDAIFGDLLRKLAAAAAVA